MSVYTTKEILNLSETKEIIFPDYKGIENWKSLLEKYPKLKFNATCGTDDGDVGLDTVFWIGKIPMKAQLELALFCRKADELTVNSIEFSAWWD